MAAAMLMFKVVLVGVGVGLLGGLFGKGGSAIATPLLQLIGVPALFAVASPLPATIPGTLVASLAYVRQGLYDRKVVLWTVALGLPFTVGGALLSDAVGGRALLLASDAIVVLLGTSFLGHHEGAPPSQLSTVASPALRAAVVGAGVGFLSGLLANSGGFLFAPLYVLLLRMPLKTAFACSLVASAALAVPGTLVHIALGHISWSVVGAMALGSVPLSYAGARVAIAANPRVLARVFGGALVAIGAAGLWHALASPA